MALDPQKLRCSYSEKTGIKVDVDDPIFALVALNEAVLEEAVERHLAELDGARRTGSRGRNRPPPTCRAASARPIPTSHEPFSRRELRLLAAAGVAVLDRRPGPDRPGHLQANRPAFRPPSLERAPANPRRQIRAPPKPKPVKPSKKCPLWGQEQKVDIFVHFCPDLKVDIFQR